MTKKQLIDKWTKEADDWRKAKMSESFKPKTKEMAYNREWQLLQCIRDIEKLTE